MARGKGKGKGKGTGAPSSPSRPGAGGAGQEEAGQGNRRRTVGLALAGLLVVEAVVLFLAFTPTPHNGGDNAGYVALAQSLLTEGQYLELWDPAAPPHTKYPPVFPLMLAGLIALGARTWTALKILPLTAALATVGLVFLLARDRRNWVFGLAVAGAFGLSDALVYHASWILSDLPFLALTLGALWALERAHVGEGTEGGNPGHGAGSPAGTRVREVRWILLGGLAAILAFFTRSAGLPLIVAVMGWLLLQRHFRALAGFSVAFGVPALAWLLRARGLTGTDYVSEFWLVNPYNPGLGRVGVGGMLARVGQNFAYYVIGVFPQGLGGIRGGLGIWVGLVLFLLALVGWGLRLRERGWRRPGPMELFAPLYLGLILLWPVVWSGDRFALPLLPLLLVYGLDALLRGGRWLETRMAGDRGAPAWSRWAGPGAVALLLAVLVVPALGVWRATTVFVTQCREVASVSGPYACNGPAWEEFAAAAYWAGANLPEGSAVLSRKPRIFYVLSGLPSATYPFVVGEDALQAARRGGDIRYVVLDRLDRTSDSYLVPTLGAMTERICGLEEWVADPRAPGTQLMGFVDGGVRAQAPVEELPQAVALENCARDYFAPAPRDWPAYSSSMRIPLLSSDP